MYRIILPFIDGQVDNMVDACFKIKKEDLSIFNKIRIRLPIKLNGIGFRRLVDVRWSEFIGRMMEGVIPLLDKTSEGNNIKEMLESSHIEHWIGRNPLDSNDGPWHRLKQQKSAMCLGMKIAYTNICGQFDQAVVLDVDEKLDKDWFYGDTSFARMTRTGVIKRGSLTHLLTREIEKGKKMTLDAKYEQNVPTDYKNITERLAWYNIDEGSA